MMKRKSNILINLLVIAVLWSIAISASAVVPPLTSWADCPADAKSTASRFAPLPIFVQGTVGSPVTSWPAVGTYNFCYYMDTLFCQLKAIGSIVDVSEYANLLRCLDADINGQVYEQPPAIVPVTISVNSSGQCNVYWNGIQTHSNITIPGWSPQANWYLGFGARTGGMNDYHIVDDFALSSPGMTYSESFASGPGLGTLYGNATIASKQLMLTDKVNSQTGSWTFLPTAAATEFTVTYLQYIGDGSGADGMCFFYGPGANSSFGETGPTDTTGLRLTFHTYYTPDNTIDLVYNGSSLSANSTVGELRQTAEWLPVSGNGMIDGQYELALLAYVLNTPTHPLHADAHAAIQTNFIFFKDLVQLALTDVDGSNYLSLVPLMVPYLIGSLALELAGYAALGDPQTYEALDAVLGLLTEIGLEPPAGGVVSVTDSIGDVGPIEDFDGDMFSNIDEYNYVADTFGLSVNGYWGYVMNPATASVVGAKYYQVGTKITLSPKLTYGGAIESVSWQKESVPLGSANPLVIDNCLYSDAGVYDMTVTHRMGDAKSTAQVIGTGTVTVGDIPAGFGRPGGKGETVW